MKKAIAMLLTAALSAPFLSGCVSTSQGTSVVQFVEASAESGFENGSVQNAESSASGVSAADTSSADETGESKAGLSSDSYTIGVGQFAEHGSLDNRRGGFMAGLAEEGIEEGVNLTAFYDNSQADSGTASQAATNLVGKGIDLMCGIVTPMAQAKCGVAKRSNASIIFTAVIDPITAELANADDTPVDEVTGTSDKPPVEAQLKMIRQIPPEAKNISIMYTISEVNSESVIAEYKELVLQYGFEIVDTGISSSVDTALAINTLTNKVDCITNLTDNTIVASLPVILDKAAAKNIPVFDSKIEQVKIGCLAAIGLDYIELDKQAGKMVAQVLRGEKKTNEMNFETIKEAAFYGNIQVTGDLGITLPEDLTGNVAEPFAAIAQ